LEKLLGSTPLKELEPRSRVCGSARGREGVKNVKVDRWIGG
jgi:hypothetical protein